MKRCLILLSGACVLTTTAAAQQVRVAVTSEPATPIHRYWSCFTSPGGGFEIPVPPGVRALSNSRTGGRASFASVDGEFKMTVWGGMSAQPGPLVMDAKWLEALSKKGRTITRNGRGSASFALTGSNSDGTQFYEKLIRSGDHIATLTVKWPGARRREFSPWVQMIDEGFNLVAPPNGSVDENRLSVEEERTPVPFDFRAGGADALTFEETEPRGRPPATPAPSTSRESTVDVTPPEPAKSTADNHRAPAGSALEPAGDGSFRKLETPPQELPVAVPVPGRKGFVYSPFLTEKKLVDAVDLPSGTKVKCPYTGKLFRLP